MRTVKSLQRWSTFPVGILLPCILHNRVNTVKQGDRGEFWFCRIAGQQASAEGCDETSTAWLWRYTPRLEPAAKQMVERSGCIVSPWVKEAALCSTV